ncbi:MAG: monofunctional biosynthetic peptidoglycan transglycosylase [Desulfobulbaceae bacterium]|nr:monofunctional biosynthetic peptidoglycan transglycosylase [Desulfobulbaceae bacterium]
MVVNKGGASRFSVKKMFLWLAKGAGALFISSVALVGILRWVPPPISAMMVYKWSAAKVAGEKFHLRYHWVSLEKMSPRVAIAVVASEDQRFPDHFGFDFEAMRRAWEENQHRKKIRGGSTISQQVAKNLFLWPGRSLVRKGMEAYFTLLLEGLWPKQRILEVYLNVAEFGPGIFGVKAASDAFFHKPPARLTPREAALLAAVLPNPKKLKVGKPSRYVKGRVQHIRKQMNQLGGPTYLKPILPRRS